MTTEESSSSGATVTVGMGGIEHETPKKNLMGFWIAELEFDGVHPGAVVSFLMLLLFCFVLFCFVLLMEFVLVLW